ncbi:OmpH family outer membrane protein [Emcibacter nanhaiensis]|uniref:OmpH family outer membrane protein n=1 Tax=Emcibacter nanhaiensis TaxID=1505037 RepID=A0A501PSH5_9PROT|nr:OmpH family outer membrane protein [Emcibacter nanhaiensis]TPD62914.1 OmpH family outer membrane protein [Emcibacter nanhaiensis]
MKHFTKFALMAAIVLGINTFSSFEEATAQALPKVAIAVIDSRRITMDSAAGKDIRRQLDVIRQKFQAEIVAKETELKKEEESLSNQRSLVPKEVYEQKVVEFRGKVADMQRDAQAKNRQLEVALVNAQNKLQSALTPIYQKILKERGANMIIDKSLVIEHNAALNVTDEVIEQLDQVLPAVKVELVTPAPAQ